MAPSATEPTEPQALLPPPQTYTPREAHFEKFIEPQRDGYGKAKSQPTDRVAIVIDNGSLFHLAIAPSCDRQCPLLQMLTLSK
jgi:actin-related protein 5